MHDSPPDDGIAAGARPGDTPAGAVAVMERYLAEVLRWNARVGLVGRQNTAGILERLVKQSVTLLGLVRRTHGPGVTSVVDVGSGGGFPGVVWAILETEWRLLLVERRGKKAAFLERTAGILALDHVEVYGGDARDARSDPAWSGRFDVAATMAVGPPARTGTLVAGFLRDGGLLATTLPREMSPSPPRAGSGLALVATEADPASLYAVYRK